MRIALRHPTNFFYWRRVSNQPKC